jgi:glycosyltransferase involved in cell wall biosynthesis
MKTLLIIGRKNGVGLDQDAALVGAALQADGWTVRHHAPTDWRALLTPRAKADAVIHLERFFPLWKWRGARHYLIPNQERFPERHVGRLKSVDHVLCKSRHAEEIFAQLHSSVRFIGFTSPDRLLPGAGPDYSRFFHLAGRSTLKGTEGLLQLWLKHPEWPVLTLVQHPDNAPAIVPPNVRLISRHVSNDELQLLQNSCGVHLCPSLSEGWGHYIVEAMSCRAVTVTTDGPPMNELVGPGRGVLVAADRSEPRRLGRNFYVDTEALEKAVAGLIGASPAEKAAIGAAARHWFDHNNARFTAALQQAVKSESPA